MDSTLYPPAYLWKWSIYPLFHWMLQDHTGIAFEMTKKNPNTCCYLGIIPCMGPASESYIVKSSLIGWAHTQNDPGY